jgi:hypothetical protein
MAPHTKPAKGGGVMSKPIVGRAIVPPMVAMVVVGSVSGSVPLMFGVGFALYPFCHLAIQAWDVLNNNNKGEMK